MTIPMVRIEGVPSAEDAKPGMAFFQSTGPVGKTCGDCKHRGYNRESKNGTFNATTGTMTYRSYRVSACSVFRKLAGGTHGPAVDRAWSACKYFEQKVK